MCSVSYHDKTKLRYIEAFAPGQDDIPRYKRKKRKQGIRIFIEMTCVTPCLPISRKFDKILHAITAYNLC